MRLMLDASADKIIQYEKESGLPILQLRTPLTAYAARLGIPFGVDNGAYSEFNEAKYLKLVAKCVNHENCLWINLPDVPYSARATTALFHEYCYISGLKITNRCYTVQDGITPDLIPWNYISAIFIGGSTEFKMGKTARVVARAARKRHKWVHVGRVNTPHRIDSWYNDADSFDGSGIAKYTVMRKAAFNCLKNAKNKPQEVF